MRRAHIIQKLQFTMLQFVTAQTTGLITFDKKAHEVLFIHGSNCDWRNNVYTDAQQNNPSDLIQSKSLKEGSTRKTGGNKKIVHLTIVGT